MNHQQVKSKLDGVGCGFCLAKWTQVTMHLDKGLTHSCHHPSPHKIPLHEIKRNPTALHNTSFKKNKRKEMLEGKRPAECNYCWNVEDNSNSFSDRVFKSAEEWSIGEFDKIKESSFRQDFNPKYVEVSFSNACNLKCAYCGPQYSSKWVEEIEKFGAYKGELNFNDIEYIKKRNEMPYKKSEYNPYVEAFWEWWPDLYKDLHTFRITGGEPLLSKDTFKVLDYISKNSKDNPNLSLAINSNLTVPDKLIDKLLPKLKDLSDNNKVKKLEIYTSVEAIGKQAEYTRYGLNYDKFWSNIDMLLSEVPKLSIVVMATFNALSVFTYDELIDKVFEMKKKHHNKQRYNISAIQLDTSYLRWPNFLSVKILEKQHLELIYNSAVKALYYGQKKYDSDNYGFTNTEIQKIKRVYDYAISDDKFPKDRQRKEFANFIKQYDKRRDTNFNKTFPQLKEFYATHSER